MRRFVVATICLLLPATLAGAQTAADATAPPFHSLESVLQTSYQHNPQLRSDRAAFAAAEEALPQAQSGYKPSVTANANEEEEHLHVDGPSLSDFGFGTINATGGISTVNGQVTEPVYRGGQTVAAIKSARSAIAAQQAMVDGDVQQIMLQVATAYVDVVHDQQVIAADEADVSDLAEQNEATGSRFQAGSTTRTDLAQAQAALAAAQAELTLARGSLKISRATFEQLVGFAPGTVAPPRLSFSMPDTLDAALALADTSNPQIVAAINLHDSSQSDIDRLRGVLLPQVSLVGAVARDDDPYPGIRIHETSEAAGLQATWALYSGGADRSRIRQAADTANQRMIDILSVRRQVRQQVISAWENLAAIRAEIESRKAQVDAARLAAEGTRKQAEVGTRSVLDATDSQQIYLNAEVTLYQAQRDETVATFTLAQTLGLLRPQILGFTEVAADDSHEATDMAQPVSEP